MYRIIGADGKEYGPITADQLRQWIAEGRANAQTKILPEGTTEWRALGEFPEFFATSPPGQAASVPPPPPSMPMPGAFTSSAAANQVSGPAIGLMVLAIVELVFQALGAIMHLAGASLFSTARMPSEAWVQMFSGTMGLIFSVLGMLISGLILLGAFKMKRLENYGLAMAASIIAMLPCSLCCVIGLPLGIWSIVVLSKPEVKSAFH
jgi:hypothetical protein